MLKFQRAVFCYYVTCFDTGLHAWIVSISPSLSIDGLLGNSDTNRQKIAKWLTDMFAKQVDFDTVLRTLTGDEFVERNRHDVTALEREAGKRITELWDTDPIFRKYPSLRGLARNKEFEEMWAKMKRAAIQKQK